MGFLSSVPVGQLLFTDRSFDSRGAVFLYRGHCRHVVHLKVAAFSIPSLPSSSSSSSAPVPLVQREWQGLLDGSFHVAAPAHAIVPGESKLCHILRVCTRVIEGTLPPTPVQHRPTFGVRSVVDTVD